VLDALSPRHKLTYFRSTAREQWYELSQAGDEFGSLADELRSMRRAGSPSKLWSVAFVLRPRQLLILNNVRAIHGRHGVHRPQELYQFILGARRVPPERAVFIRDWLTAVLSDEQTP
jgi:hypothetical protein